jgi:hypothetical protein
MASTLSAPIALRYAGGRDVVSEFAMSGDDEPPSVVFRVRVGRQEFTCRGHLIWEGGIVFAVPEMADDGIFVPEKIRLEESDLELKHDSDLNLDWYQYHGYVVLPNI